MNKEREREVKKGKKTGLTKRYIFCASNFGQARWQALSFYTFRRTILCQKGSDGVKWDASKQ